LPHFGQVTSNNNPQLPHFFQSFSIGFLHFGQRNGPSGLTFPQNGQVFESASISLPQY